MVGLAWLAHLYTGLGAVVALWAMIAVFAGNFRTAFLALGVQIFIDATDGILARAARVKERLPFFDGALLDNIIDFLTYVFIPVLLIFRANLLPEGGREFPIGALIVLASAYGFCRTDAKVEIQDEYFFTGFPSYWNVVALYLYIWRPEQETCAAVLVVLALLVFLPLRYVYPSRTKTLRGVTMALGCIWAAIVMWMVWRLPETDGPWFALSLVFPMYYVVLSLWLDVKSRRPRGSVLGT